MIWVLSGMVVNVLVFVVFCLFYCGIVCYCDLYIENDEVGVFEFYINGVKLILVDGLGVKLLFDGIVVWIDEIVVDVYWV